MKYIMLVDDTRSEVPLFRHALAELGISGFIYAPSFHGMLSALDGASNLPEAIFLDINMPGRGGMECLTALKADARYAAIPVYMYSTTALEEEYAPYLKRGAEGYFPKPLLFGDLVKGLHKILLAAYCLLDLGCLP